MDKLDLPTTLMPGLPAQFEAPRPVRRADGQLGDRMAQTRNNPGPTAAPAGDTSTHTTGTWQQPVIESPANFREPRQNRLRQRPGLTDGMRQRLLHMISQQRAARAEADAVGLRRQEVIQGLVRAKKFLNDITAARARKVWLHNSDRWGKDPELETEFKVRSQHVQRLQTELERLTNLSAAAAKRAANMRATIGRIGAANALGRSQVVFADTEPEMCDTNLLEERLLQ